MIVILIVAFRCLFFCVFVNILKRKKKVFIEKKILRPAPVEYPAESVYTGYSDCSKVRLFIFIWRFFLVAEAVVCRCSSKQMFLKIS